MGPNMKKYKKDSCKGKVKPKISMKYLLIGFFASLLIIYIATVATLMRNKKNEDRAFIENAALAATKSKTSSNTDTSSNTNIATHATKSNTEPKPSITVGKKDDVVPIQTETDYAHDDHKHIKAAEQSVVKKNDQKAIENKEKVEGKGNADKGRQKGQRSISQDEVNDDDDPGAKQPLPLKAYIEHIDQSLWDVKPLPTRQTKSSDLKEISFHSVNSCRKLPQQWPIDEEVAPTNKDPFLPWIHDVFPTADGKYIQFVAQNKRRCQTGIRKGEIKKFMQPNVAIFQHVPIKRVKHDNSTSTRYKLTSHEDADSDGIETRFICRFKPSMEETLSVFNFNYDYHTLRKNYKSTFTLEGFDNHMVWSSQLLFKCPVPESLQEDVKSGKTVFNDYASLYVDLIPIRTPPRYGPPTTYLPHRLFDEKNTWDVDKEWGQNHILPLIEDSGRWENIPICKPSLMTYPDEEKLQSEKSFDTESHKEHDARMLAIAESGKKKHELISCTWTSASFKTRGGRTSVNDGEERLLQWLQFNKLVGIDHVYIYDNTGAFTKDRSLKAITDKFPGFVTRINWPAKVCNNNRGNADNKGERSSQYAADASCRLRFGAHSTWLASVDTDEYLVPLEKYNNLKELLKDVEKEDIRVLNFYSKRSRARLRYLNTTAIKNDVSCFQQPCFDPSLPANNTFLEVYNCNNEKPPRRDVQPAEKAIYKPDYVLQFFVHYAAVTQLSATGKEEARAKGEKWIRRYNYKNHLRYIDEKTEATMLHTKAIVTKETRSWNSLLTSPYQTSRSLVGVEWPEGMDQRNFNDDAQISKTTVSVNGQKYYPNCHPVPWIKDYWSPKLSKALKEQVGFGV